MATDTYQRESDGTLSAYAWPGGYDLYYVMDDGGVLCPACANLPEVHIGGEADGWRLECADANYEDDDLFCAHCNAQIPASYTDD